MQCYTELTPPTAVTHAESLSFLGPSCNNLVIAKHSQLQIFDLISVVTEVANDTDQTPNIVLTGKADTSFLGDSTTVKRTEYTSKLSLVAEYALYGTVTSLKKINSIKTRCGGEALLVSTKDAKASLLEWDPEALTLRTISVHYYEHEELHHSPWSPKPSHCHSFLTVDPSGRCAALKFGQRNLAIIPFRQLGEDIDEGEYDSDSNEGANVEPHEKVKPNGQIDAIRTPYSSSFVLPLTALDPNIIHLVDISFLYEFREPTFGIVSSSVAPSAPLMRNRKDPLTYAVFTLDLDQRASTTLLSIGGLPYDLFGIVPLPAPIGGSLLIGGNEMIHVDQAGKTVGVAVNEFALQCSDFPMTDQRELGLKLEDCIVEQLEPENGDILLIASNGELYLISFKLDGRTVSTFSIQQVAEERGGMIFPATASCAASLGRGKCFIGSEHCDSALIGFSQRTAQLARKRSRADVLMELGDISADEEDFEDFEDDIYAANPLSNGDGEQVSSDCHSSSSYHFRIHDVLKNNAPLQDITVMRLPAVGANDAYRQSKVEVEGIQLIGSCGKKSAGDLLTISRNFQPISINQFSLPDVVAIWSIHAKKPTPEGLPRTESGKDSEAAVAADVEYDQLLFVSRISDDGLEESTVYDILPNTIEEKHETEFAPDGATIDVGTLNDGTRVIQILKNEIRSYDLDLRLAQIYPINDEDSDIESEVQLASFADPYILIIKVDGGAIILEADTSGEFDKIDQSDALASSKWLSGCIYKSTNIKDHAILCLLSEGGSIKLFDIANLRNPMFSVEGVHSLPLLLSASNASRRGTKADLAHIMLADLGDEFSQYPYLFICCTNGDLNIYKPYCGSIKDENQIFSMDMQWHKMASFVTGSHTYGSPHNIKNSDARFELKAIRLDNYSSIFVGGIYPRLIIKNTASLPICLDLKNLELMGMTSFHTPKCERGFIYLMKNKDLQVCQLPSNVSYNSKGWSTKRFSIGHDVCGVGVLPGKDLFVVGTSEELPYAVPEDDYHWEWSKEDIALKPSAGNGLVHLYHPATHSIIDTYRLNDSEEILSLKTLNLEVSEITHERKHLIAVGTIVLQGEDLPSKGNIYIFDVITVVPQPGRPETNQRLKLIVKEEVKGAVTSLSEIGSQGFLIAAQGQKCMVRGLKEDRTLLPVAFMDMQCYTSVVKELSGTGLLLLGDAAKGSWFVGYTEEPYKMTIFGKAKSPQEVLNAEFLPFEKQLYIIIADADCNIHVLQFDPEHPKSLSGQRLLHKSSFHTGYFPSTMSLLSSDTGLSGANDVDVLQDMNYARQPVAQPQVLMTMQSGVISLLTPLEEQMYRRLVALQTYLGNLLEHPLGLNPRAFRAVEGDGYASRGIVDGNLVLRWYELGAQRRAEACAKAGSEDWLIRNDLEYISGAGMGYL